MTDRMIAGRQLTLPLMVATLVATWYGDLFGVTQIAFEKGLYMFVTQGICWYAAYLAFALLMARRLRRSQALSLCHLVEQMHGRRASCFVAVLMFFHALPLSCAVGGGVLFQLLTGLPLPLAMLLIVFVATLFSHIDGLNGVARSDAVQFLFMCGAVASVVVFSAFKWGGLSFLQQHLPEAHLQWKGHTSWQATGIWFLIAISMTFLNPAFCQRCLAARDERTARWGVLVACGVWVLFDSCTLIGGLYARAHLPEVDSVHAYYTYGVGLLPIGVRGMFIAGILATIFSTLDSFLLLSSSLLTDDLKLFSRLPNRSRQVISASICALLTLCAPFCFGLNAESIWLWVDGLFSCSLLFPLTLGRFLKLNGHSFLLAGFLGGLGMIIAKLLSDGMEALFIGFGCSLVSVIGLSVWKSKRFSSSPMESL